MRRTNLRKWLWIAAVLIALAIAPAAGVGAQDDDETETVLYLDFSASAGYITAVNAEGSRVIDLPDELYFDRIGEAFDTFATYGVRLSPDGRWLAVGTRYRHEGGILPPRIARVEDAACCWTFDLPPDTAAYELAGFDPASERLALSYVTEGSPMSGGIMVVPVPFIEFSEPSYLSMDEVAQSVPELPSGVWARVGDWQADGIRFYPSCYACDGVFEGEYAIWNPNTGGFIAHSGEFFSVFGVRLEATGEMVIVANDPAYPSSPQEGMFPPPNVIRYSPSGDPMGRDSWVIYHDPETLDLGRVDWVLDGEAILIAPPGTQTWILVYRDGTVRKAGYDLGNYYFTGTAQGWLALSGDEEGNGLVVHYDVDTRREVAMIGNNEATVLRRPLGVNLPQAPQPFPEVGVNVTQCPGFMASRLVAGRQGRVTPGTPNRIRDFPNLSRSSVIGEIPGGGVFNVIDGPVCDPDAGIVWQKVEYGGLIGWTAEGQGDTYFTEPVE